MLPSVLVRTARDQRRSVTVWAAALVGDGATLLDSHITIVNAAVGVDGRRGALGWNPPCSPGLGSPGTSTQPALRRRMVQRLGLEWDQPIKGTADLAGVPAGCVVHFFQRRRQALESCIPSATMAPTTAGQAWVPSFGGRRGRGVSRFQSAWPVRSARSCSGEMARSS